MTLREAEVKLNEVCTGSLDTEEQKTEVYQACLDFTTRFYNWKRCCRSRLTYDQVVVVTAEELYMQIAENKIPGSWFRYVNRGYKGYFDICHSLYGYGNLDYRTRKLLEENYVPVRHARYSPSEVNLIVERIDTSDSLLKLYLRLNRYLYKCGKFKDHKERSNVRITLQLSIKYGKYINFRLSKKTDIYCRYLYNLFKKKFRELAQLSYRPSLSDGKFISAMSGELWCGEDT